MADQAAAFRAAFDRFASKLTADLVIEIVRQVAQATPVDTGWAASNWIPSIGQPRAGTFGSKLTVSQAAQKLGLAQLASGYSISSGPVFVVNHVPYIVHLNAGSSTKAPAAFVERSIASAIQTVLNRG